MQRNVSKHIESINGQNIKSKSGLRHRMKDFDLPYLPAGKGSTDREMRIWIEGHYDRVTRYFEAVAPGRFLAVWLEDEPVEAVAQFLQCHGNFTMPHANQRSAASDVSARAVLWLLLLSMYCSLFL